MNVFKKTLVVNTPGFFGEELLELLRCSQEVIIFMEDVAGTKELLHKLPQII